MLSPTRSVHGDLLSPHTCMNPGMHTTADFIRFPKNACGYAQAHSACTAPRARVSHKHVHGARFHHIPANAPVP